MRTTLSIAAVSMSLALSGSACKKDEAPAPTPVAAEPAPAAAETPTAAEPAPAAAETPTAAEPAPAPADKPAATEPAPNPTPAAPAATEDAKPRTKDFAFPADDALGKLPADIGLAVGATIPAATVQDTDGKDVVLGDLLAREKTLVVFYRGGWCPFCNTQLRGLTEAWPWFTERGVKIIAISVDKPEAAAKSRSSWSIPFPVLSDSTLAAHKAFNVSFKVPEAEVERLKGFGLDLEGDSGQTHHTVAVPALFLLDQNGVVQWSHAELDYKTRPSVAQVQAIIEATFKPTP